MITLIYQLLLLIFFIVLIYFISRYTINNFYYLFYSLFKNQHFVFSLISLFFLPGTIIHELAHFFTVIILFLKPQEIKIFPEWQDNYLKLGSVVYEKKDVIRSIIVGIAPFFIALLILFIIASLNIFPNNNLFINILIIYFIFVLTTTMFSSEKDLQDLIFIIPLVIIIAAIIYIFDLRINILFENQTITQFITILLNKINTYLLISLATNIIIILLLKSTKKLLNYGK